MESTTRRRSTPRTSASRSRAADRVDPEALARPRRWDVRRIRNFMAVFGLLSSIFDYLTFLVLLYGVHAPMRQFRTGWFVESVVSASIVALILRTRRPFAKS